MYPPLLSRQYCLQIRFSTACTRRVDARCARYVCVGKSLKPLCYDPDELKGSSGDLFGAKRQEAGRKHAAMGSGAGWGGRTQIPAMVQHEYILFVASFYKCTASDLLSVGSLRVLKQRLVHPEHRGDR